MFKRLASFLNCLCSALVRRMVTPLDAVCAASKTGRPVRFLSAAISAAERGCPLGLPCGRGFVVFFAAMLLFLSSRQCNKIAQVNYESNAHNFPMAFNASSCWRSAAVAIQSRSLPTIQILRPARRVGGGISQRSIIRRTVLPVQPKASHKPAVVM